MLQLGIAREFAGQEEDAKRWYGRIVKDFADSPAAKKAAGAITRLDSVGKTIDLSGKGVDGGEIDLAKYRGKVVLIQYWATWCGPCKADMPALKELLTKYDSSFTVLGVSLDANAKDLNRPSGREPLALAADLRGGRAGQPAGESAGHPHPADDDPRRSARQRGQPQHPDGRYRGRTEEVDSLKVDGRLEKATRGL